MTARDRKRSRSDGSEDPFAFAQTGPRSHSERAEHLAAWRPRDPAKTINDTSNLFEL